MGSLSYESRLVGRRSLDDRGSMYHNGRLTYAPRMVPQPGRDPGPTPHLGAVLINTFAKVVAPGVEPDLQVFQACVTSSYT